jgi:hypothetical protein
MIVILVFVKLKIDVSQMIVTVSYFSNLLSGKVQVLIDKFISWVIGATTACLAILSILGDI